MHFLIHIDQFVDFYDGKYSSMSIKWPVVGFSISCSTVMMGVFSIGICKRTIGLSPITNQPDPLVFARQSRRTLRIYMIHKYCINVHCLFRCIFIKLIKENMSIWSFVTTDTTLKNYCKQWIAFFQTSNKTKKTVN